MLRRRRRWRPAGQRVCAARRLSPCLSLLPIPPSTLINRCRRADASELWRTAESKCACADSGSSRPDGGAAAEGAEGAEGAVYAAAAGGTPLADVDITPQGSPAKAEPEGGALSSYTERVRAGVAGARASLAGSGLSLTRSKESRLTSVLTGARDQAADNVEQLGAVSESVEAMHEESAGFASMAAQARRQQSEGFLGDRI